MNARLNYSDPPSAQEVVKHLVSAGRAVTGLAAARRDPRAGRDPGQPDQRLRRSALDMHTKDAEHAGETSVRLNLVAAWREATVFTEAERAALELTEQGTRIADGAGGVTDEAWANAAKHYDEDQLGRAGVQGSR